MVDLKKVNDKIATTVNDSIQEVLDIKYLYQRPGSSVSKSLESI
jgi:hypothetical protein